MIQLLTEYIRITYVRRWSLLLAVLLTLNGCCFGEISQLNICVKNQNFNFKSFIGKCSFSLTFNFQYLLVLILVLTVLMVKGGSPFLAQRLLPQKLLQQRLLPHAPVFPAPFVSVCQEPSGTNSLSVRRFSGSLRVYGPICLCSLKLKLNLQ